jgi:tripartite-type tricarboxylate transporter receptor subunit TctC
MLHLAWRVAVAFIALFPMLLAQPAAAQDYPARPVKIIVPFGAGGPADVFSRQLAQHLTEQLKQSFVVEDRPGAGSIIGTNEVAKSAPDGYTLLTMSNTHTTNESLTPNKPFQLMRDFVPVAAINYSDRASVGSGEGSQGIHRTGEKGAGQTQLCLVGAGHAVSHGWRVVQTHERYQHRACPA